MKTVMDPNDEVPVTPTKENKMQTFSPSPHSIKWQRFYSPSPSESSKKTYNDKFGKYFLFFCVPYI